MLARDRLQAALAEKAASFDRFDAELNSRLEMLSTTLDEIGRKGYGELARALANLQSPGAMPTAEWENGCAIPFATTWSDHPSARAWARGVLEGRPTFAADGSQIEPDKRFSVPAALVQVGWFENLHLASGETYRKDVDMRVLGPGDLREDEIGPPKRKVDLARFELEVQALRRYLAEESAAPKGRVAFFDGSLVVSFAEKRKEDAYARRYVELVIGLLQEAEARRVPLVAYVDTSYAHDLAEMIASYGGFAAQGGVSDGALLIDRLAWGDRTPTAICARPGILDAYGEWSRRIGFCYLKTSSDAPPARLEYPLWLLERGRLDEVLDVVRAEVIAGGGYPYTLAAADAAAVLTMSDRESFQRALQDFLASRSVPLRFSKKALSKVRRR